ncbi:DUF6344 domain-containing protein [Streptomyces sp. NBC_00239]|uniref:DUF6344 domain-containing protein n=1 Tax=Streptomyces sp. NBC_00239 TaxID=2903640 RepID=UPI002E285DC1|nr:DUF6344 domain-containing protein [Streptomyces sp. NBC_00239]
MAGNNRVASLWTTVVTALVAFFTVLGFGAAAKAAARPAAGTASSGAATDAPTAPPLAAAAAPRSATSSASGTAARVSVPVQDRRSRREALRGGALPPTIAQRIRAEAHGSSPSVRRSTTADSTAVGHVTPQDLDLAA